MTTRRNTAIISLLLLLLLLASCGTSRSDAGGGRDTSRAHSDYNAVPDNQLFAAIDHLPMVRSSDLRHVSELGESNSYRGDIRLQSGLPQKEVTKVYDQVITILRHGRFNADCTAVLVSSGSTQPDDDTADLYLPEDFKQRYGPQTGEEGWPPPFVPN